MLINREGPAFLKKSLDRSRSKLGDNAISTKSLLVGRRCGMLMEVGGDTFYLLRK